VDETGPCNVCPPDETSGRLEWEKLFPSGPLGSPFQDGHYIYAVVPGMGAEAPTLYIADLVNPAEYNTSLKP
jgi:hypothetical protein